MYIACNVVQCRPMPTILWSFFTSAYYQSLPLPTIITTNQYTLSLPIITFAYYYHYQSVYLYLRLLLSLRIIYFAYYYHYHILTFAYYYHYQLLHLPIIMLCYVIWLFVKRLSQKAIQRRSQCDRLMKM